MIEGSELLKQTVQAVIGTNKGEWVLNSTEGIKFSNILGKGNTEDIIRNEIQQGLLQIDDTFVLTSFSIKEIDKRKYKISFSAKNSSGEQVNATNFYS